MRGERSRRLAYPTSGFCSESNPSPGTMISTPEFGCELFVAHRRFLAKRQKLQPKVIHRHRCPGHLNILTLNQFAANPAVRRNRPASRWFNRGSNPHADCKSAPLAGDGRNPTTVRDGQTRARAQPEVGSVNIARAIFPPPKGGLLSRTSIFIAVAADVSPLTLLRCRQSIRAD